MIHSNGIAFATEMGLYRTGRANAIFRTIASTTTINRNKKSRFTIP
ncbi:hypothetical protein Hsw_2843 [Hymenobacter swuensis DY53]|uniref:Uncharacterized protein n=1 Tax=Hymenobacter swuensis DY53 TaxID=1227739 RepID=W8F0M3_9BACT|nr:hypothetical protein Hsw_2843 [Hymenobacter swuensis DY53]